MSRTNITEVCFSVDGQFLSNTARDLVCEGNWDRAVTFLTDSLIGMTTDQAISILKGEFDLFGNSSDEEGVFMQETPNSDASNEIIEQLDYLYGNCFRYRDKYWKPYAEVSAGLNDEDLDWATRYPSTPFNLAYSAEDDGSEYSFDLTIRRAMRYSNSPFSDLAVVIKSNNSTRIIICEPTDKPPFWYSKPVNVDPSEFLQGLLDKGISFESRGAFSELFEEAKAYSESSVSVDDLPEPSNAPLSFTTKITIEEASALINQHMMEALSLISFTSDPVELENIQKDLERKKRKIEAQLRGILIEDEDAYNRYVQVEEHASMVTQNLLKTRIVEQAKKQGGFFTLELKDDDGNFIENCPESIEIPKFPFMMWALGHNYVSRFVEDFNWDPVSFSGYKMQCDDPYHTDWMVGAGLNIDDAYTSDPTNIVKIVMNAAYKHRFDLRYELRGENFVVLAQGNPESQFTGTGYAVKENEVAPDGFIPIAPHAGPEYQMAMVKAGIIICETGGKLAHLATVGREMKCTVIMQPKAIKQYSGVKIFVDTNAKSIRDVVWD